MEKKSDKVRRMVSAGDYKSALRIAKDFTIGISNEDHVTMTRAFECMVHPDFYRQLGYDPEEEKEKGISAVTRIYGSK